MIPEWDDSTKQLLIEIVERLGGAAGLEASARQTQALLRARVVDRAVCLLRLILAYCPSQRGLRCTAAWATSIGLVDSSNVALLYRLRRCGDWLAVLVGRALTVAAPQGSRGRLLRIIDATTVPKAGTLAKTKTRLWRVHSAFDLPGERFGFFELTDQQGGETLDRIPVVAGEPVDVLAEFGAGAASGPIDRPIWLARKSGAPLSLRLVAVKKTAQAAAAARRKARQAARKAGTQSRRAHSPPPNG